jgi:hypothetical protein
MSENQDQGSERSQGANRPLFKKGDVSVFEHRHLEDAYQIVNGEKDGPKEYVTVWRHVGAAGGGAQLTPEQAGRLFLGEDIAMALSKKDSDEQYEAIVGSKGIKTDRPVKNGKTFTNHTLDVGIALPLKRNTDQSLFAYKVGGITYFTSVGSQKEPVNIDLKEIFKLAGGYIVEKGDVSLKVGEIKDGQYGKVAAVYVNKIDQGKKEEQEPDLEVDEAEGMPNLDTDEGEELPASRKI